MNHIKKLEIFGFKSFSGRKEITFPEGLNCIMGPNGSGKSNVTEAICFVLGKASKKDLRAERLGDLVFNGGKKLPPSKFAKVTIVIDNKNRRFPIDDDEVRISRKVDREGRSLFRVNGKRETREYVKNLLAYANIDADGYNIVMQGEIEKFVDLSPDERRKIIEDLSGISVYEEKKHKCMLEIEKVNQKLKEANIILNEKIKHMEELKKEKEEAEKFNDLKEKLRYKKASKLFKEIEEINSEKRKLEEKVLSKQKEIEELTNTKQEISKKIDEISKEIESINKTTEELGETEQIELNNQIENLRIRINEINAEIKGRKNEIVRINERKKQIQKDIEINKENSKKSEERLKKLSEESEALKKKLEKLKEEFKLLSNLDKERVEIKSKINEVEKEIINIKGELSTFEERIKGIEKKKELEKELNLKERILKEKAEEDSSLAIKISGLKEERDKLNKQLHTFEGKKEILFGLLKKGVRAILQAKERGEIKGIHGLVYDLAKVDEKYSVPIKVAAGNRSNAIVVDNVDVAKECIRFLRENKLGVATFLPLDKLRTEKIKKEIKVGNGVVGYAIDLIKYDKRYENVFNYILSDTLIVKDIETAKRVGINKYRMVTLKGDLIEKSGAISGGHRQKETLGFSSEPLDEKIEKIKSEISEIASQITSLESKREKLFEDISNMRSEIFHLNSTIESIEDVNEEKLKELKEKLKEKEKLRAELEAKLKEMPSKADEELLNKLSKDIETTQTKINELEAKKGGIKFEIEISQKDLERSTKLLEELQKEEENFKKTISSLEDESKKLESDLKKKLEEEKRFHSKLRELYEKRNKLNDKIKQLEIKKARIDEKIEKIRDEFNNLKLKLAEVNAKLEGKNTAMQEFSDIKIEKVNKSIKELEKEIHTLEMLISNFGAVNLRALDVYKEVEKEYNELKEKYDKLNEEKNEILKVMEEVEEKKKEAFFETFNNVAKNFERVFSILSPNGEGKLVLENEDNPFEGGLDIIARPGGKKFISLRAMSGGEKTLTTLAFIFAVQEYIPSPFYIMDEVEAALDRENSERLAQLLAEYSKTSQFIVVTHNDAVLAHADTIYGVHMNQLGESQIVSVKLPKR
ncbi:MAG: chromosome segregation protein SMC [Nanoarchaeota archaeon]|nr:chromosome segregation protein SMC [Nanoarchaeota archaeon]